MRHCIRLSRLIFATVLLPVFGSGCATGPVYKSSVQSLQDGAQIVTSSYEHTSFFRTMNIQLTSIDRTELSMWSGQKVLADPGIHVLTFVFGFKGFVLTSSGKLELEGDLQAGHTYVVKAEARRFTADELKPEAVKEQPQNYTRWRVAFWIEDSVTHAAVSQRRTIKPIWCLDPFGKDSSKQ